MNSKQPPKQILFKYFSNNLTASVLRFALLVWWLYIYLCFTFFLSSLGVCEDFSLVVIMCINKQAICSLKVFLSV